MNPLTDDAGIRVEAATPERVAQDHDSLAPGDSLVIGERSAERRGYAKHREQIRRHTRALESLRLPVAGEVEVSVLEQRDVVEDAGELTQVDGVGGRGIVVSTVPCQPDADEPLRLRKGQWPKHHAVDDAEDRGCRADSKRDDHDRRDSEEIG